MVTPPESPRNWAGNIAYRAAAIEHPTSVAEVARLVSSSPRVRALGSRHSFSDIADTEGILVSLDALDDAPRLLGGDRVRVSGGMTYGELGRWLEERGRALANLASLPHISVAGAVATGTHGSGQRIGSLATQVAAVEFVDGTGTPQRLDRGDSEFEGVVVGLGSLGIVTALELDTEPSYAVAQSVFEGAHWDAVLEDFDDLQASGDSVSLFTTWRSADIVDQVWIKSRGEATDLSSFGAHPATVARHPLPGIDAEPCTPQLGVRGPWLDRLPHFRHEFTPSAGDELQSEYFVARSDVAAAITALRSLAPQIAELLLVCEIRTIAADSLWLSGAVDRETVGLHFTWRLDEPAVTAFLPTLERALPSNARPHWGKVFTLPGAEIARRYPRWDDFTALRARFDPERRFANAWTDRLGL